MEFLESMFDKPRLAPGRFCWMDLAATDAGRAKDFYRELFGWTSHEQLANGGVFTKLRLSGRDVASIYQLRRVYLEAGVPSHWTPYVQVRDMDKTLERVASLGGKVVIEPFEIVGMARLALVLDSVGAFVGLWESAGPHNGGGGYA